MTWVIQESTADRVAQTYGVPRVFILSNSALAAGTYSLTAVLAAEGITINNRAGINVISIVCDAAAAGSATFTTASADVKRKVSLVAGENTRKAENSAYWFGHQNSDTSIVTDVLLNDLQLVVWAG